MNALARYLTQSTLKREATSVIMLWYLTMGTILMLQSHPTVTFKETWQDVGWMVFGAFTAAFGFDAVAKQTNWGGPPINTETTVKTEMTDDSATVTTKSEPTT